ncbi:MAG TPA: hypothetical protein PLZ84_03270, partial [Clostridia bacterium]|nr:hypothetical protein [Clostridia bacterium]
MNTLHILLIGSVIAAILLLINDVSVLDIVADYTLSATYLRPVYYKPYEEILQYPQEIEQVIEHLNNKY